MRVAHITHGDVVALARAMHAAPKGERVATGWEIVSDAAEAFAHCRKDGCHQHRFGDGCIMPAALRRDTTPEGRLDDPNWLRTYGMAVQIVHAVASKTPPPAPREKLVAYFDKQEAHAWPRTYRAGVGDFGFGWFTDNQLRDLVGQDIAAWRRMQRQNRANRKLAAE